jgi:hypothetical protein
LQKREIGLLYRKPIEEKEKSRDHHHHLRCTQGHHGINESIKHMNGKQEEELLL